MIRIGHGYDVHRLAEGRRLILGEWIFLTQQVCSVIRMPMC